MATDTDNALIETAHHGEGPVLLGLDAEGWVYVSLTIFILAALFIGKAHRMVTNVLDQRIADTRRSLDEAAALRAEAEAVLADARAKQAAAHRDAEGILAHAKVEAGQLVDKARIDADTLIERRGRMAEDKIAAAGRTAVADVRARAAQAAAAAAGRIIAARHDAYADRTLVDRTIANLG